MSESMRSWSHMLIAFAGLGITTVITRGSFFMLPASLRLPPRMEQALRYAPACALAAIVAPDLLTINGNLAIGWHNNELWAALLAAAVYAKTRNMLLMMVVGMTLFTVLRLYA